MGRLKWSPFQYYTSSPQEFYYACLGYFNERDDNINLLRTVTQFICAAQGVKPSDFDSSWPSVGAKSKDHFIMDDEMKRKILIANNINPDGYIK